MLPRTYADGLIFDAELPILEAVIKCVVADRLGRVVLNCDRLAVAYAIASPR